MALVKLQHPELDIRILFMRDQPIRKGSNTMYSDVCDKLGYVYAFKEIPSTWLLTTGTADHTTPRKPPSSK
jgi:hypothetical protein